jgi:hypothetical protein
LQDKYGFLKPTSLKEGLMAFGFDCGDGWLGILEELFEKIDEFVKEEKPGGFKVIQVKEKFGCLSVYVEGGNEVIERMIREAGAKAVKTCQECGAPGQLRQSDTGWWRTECEACRAKRPSRWSKN